MSVKPIVEALDKLTQLHQSLLKLSKDKTESLKKGSIDQLQALLVQERKHVQAINQLEEKRMKLVENWAITNQLDPAAINVSSMLEILKQDSDKELLKNATTQLAEIMVELKQQEKLNQELTQQSLQFVQLTMDMISPTLRNMNYGNSAKQQSNNRSVFDSKA
ncbi:flagellar protein FlgN [Aquibacillus albus]|uniref:Flagellar protein FlgN n=1 Tax=Aquibacillus albus TaxID=1168171 RepID=A0ABS2MWH1_9BACI|nr:flagellar protein FlgN [Aquibacillus albus]MBM7570247.1 hypothetical protein [Aquibacillus albus]